MKITFPGTCNPIIEIWWWWYHLISIIEGIHIPVRHFSLEIGLCWNYWYNSSRNEARATSQMTNSLTILIKKCRLRENLNQILLHDRSGDKLISESLMIEVTDFILSEMCVIRWKIKYISTSKKQYLKSQKFILIITTRFDSCGTVFVSVFEIKMHHYFVERYCGCHLSGSNCNI